MAVSKNNAVEASNEEEDSFNLRPMPKSLKLEERKKENLAWALRGGQVKLVSSEWEFTFMEYLLCTRSSSKRFLIY